MNSRRTRMYVSIMSFGCVIMGSTACAVDPPPREGKPFELAMYDGLDSGFESPELTGVGEEVKMRAGKCTVFLQRVGDTTYVNKIVAPSRGVVELENTTSLMAQANLADLGC